MDHIWRSCVHVYIRKNIIDIFFFISLLQVNEILALTIKNCSTYKNNFFKEIKNNSKNKNLNEIDFSDIECFFAFSDRAQCRAKRLSDLEICETIKGFKRGIETYENMSRCIVPNKDSKISVLGNSDIFCLFTHCCLSFTYSTNDSSSTYESLNYYVLK